MDTAHAPPTEHPTDAAPRPPRHRVDPRALRWWTVRALISVTVAVLPQIVALVITGSSWLITSTALTAVAGIGYLLIMPRWRYRVHRWEADEHAVYALAGWLSLEWRVAPISRIQTIDTQRTALQRLFRLATSR